MAGMVRKPSRQRNPEPPRNSRYSEVSHSVVPANAETTRL
jgi:hypothetical protein